MDLFVLQMQGVGAWQADFCLHTEVQVISSLFSEVIGLIEGLRLVNTMGFHDIEIQVDSLILVKIIRDQIPIPWRRKKYILELK